VNRTLFGFNSLEEAMEKSIELQKRISPIWTDYIMELAKKNTSFDGKILPLVQSLVPNVGIIIPSELDRKNGKVENDFPVWVMPFGTGGAQILVPGGVITKRATPYESTSK
jgi:hypothetical protein